MIEYKIKELKNYLEFLQNQYGWIVHIHEINTLFGKYSAYLSGFDIHRNKYCELIKPNVSIWQACLEEKKEAIKKSQHGVFYNICHAGVGEYVVPIFYLQRSIGFISIGIFKDDIRDANMCICNIGEKCKLPVSVLIEGYQNELSSNIPNIDLVSTIVTPAARMIELIYSEIFIQESENNYDSAKSFLNHQIKYFIEARYTKKISVKQLSDFYNCSESYINHIFKKMNGISISRYINLKRLELSKYLLISTEHSIREIAFEVGFNDYSYFSNIFKEFYGVSPKEFRKCDKEIETP